MEYTIIISRLMLYYLSKNAWGKGCFYQQPQMLLVHFDWFLQQTVKITAVYSDCIHKTGCYWVSISDEGSGYALNDLTHCEGDKTVLRDLHLYVCGLYMG